MNHTNEHYKPHIKTPANCHKRIKNSTSNDPKSETNKNLPDLVSETFLKSSQILGPKTYSTKMVKLKFINQNYQQGARNTFINSRSLSPVADDFNNYYMQKNYIINKLNKMNDTFKPKKMKENSGKNLFNETRKRIDANANLKKIEDSIQINNIYQSKFS